MSSISLRPKTLLVLRSNCQRPQLWHGIFTSSARNPELKGSGCTKCLASFESKMGFNLACMGPAKYCPPSGATCARTCHVPLCFRLLINSVCGLPARAGPRHHKCGAPRVGDGARAERHDAMPSTDRPKKNNKKTVTYTTGFEARCRSDPNAATVDIKRGVAKKERPLEFAPAPPAPSAPSPGAPAAPAAAPARRAQQACPPGWPAPIHVEEALGFWVRVGQEARARHVE